MGGIGGGNGTAIWPGSSFHPVAPPFMSASPVELYLVQDAFPEPMHVHTLALTLLGEGGEVDVPTLAVLESKGSTYTDIQSQPAEGVNAV